MPSELELLSPRAHSVLQVEKESLFSKMDGVFGKKVMRAMRSIPREDFMPSEGLNETYNDLPYQLPDTNGKSSISQPSTVALMTQLLRVRKTDSVLEIGAATGYQAAILGRLAKKVVSVEYLPEMAVDAQKRVKRLGINNVDFVTADGSSSLTKKEQFDKILVTASVFPHPQGLSFLDALKIGGICVVPIGGDVGEPNYCKLTKLKKTESGFQVEEFLPNYGFVLMEGENGWAKMTRKIHYAFHQQLFRKEQKPEEPARDPAD